MRKVSTSKLLPAILLLALLNAGCESTGCADWSKPDENCVCTDGEAAEFEQCIPSRFIDAGEPSEVIADGPWAGWGVNFGSVTIEEDPPVLRHDAPSEGKTSYFVATQSVLTDLASFRSLSFERKIQTAWSGESYDIIIHSPQGVAYRSMSEPDGANWQKFSFSLEESDGWYTNDGSFGEVLETATSLTIRAEFSSGRDTVFLKDFDLKN